MVLAMGVGLMAQAGDLRDDLWFFADFDRQMGVAQYQLMQLPPEERELVGPAVVALQSAVVGAADLSCGRANSHESLMPGGDFVCKVLGLACAFALPSGSMPDPQEELRAVARELRADLVRVAADTKRPFGEGVRITMPSAGTYYGLWPDDWLFPNKLVPELLSDAEAKALFRFLTDNLADLPQLPDRIEPSGHCVFQPGAENRPHGKRMPAHLPAAWLRLVRHLRDRTGDTAFVERWRGVIARSIDQLRFEDGLPSLAEDQVGFGFFDTVALQGQDLMCSVVLWKAFADAEPLFGGELGAKCRGLAEGIRANIVRLRASEGWYLSDSLGCRQFSPWSNGILYSSGLVGEADRRAIRERIWADRGKLVKFGMVRHAPEVWRKMKPVWAGGEGSYMNGGYWSVGTAYAFAALYDRDPAYAAALAREMLENLRKTDYAEWVNAERSQQGAHKFLMGLALPLAAIEAVLGGSDLISYF